MKKTLMIGVIAFSMIPMFASAATLYVDATATGSVDGSSSENAYTTLLAAISIAPAGSIISVASGTYELPPQLNVTHAISIVGQGDVVIKPLADFGTTNGSKHLFTALGGAESAPVEVSHVTFDCEAKCYGVQAYGNAHLTLTDVTIKNSKGAGLTVNGSTVIASDLKTSGNAWGSVNVDPGSGVTTPSLFTLTSGTLSESNQIWSDGDHVTPNATVTVNADGYIKYAVGGTTAGFIWTNGSLTNKATVGSTLYSSIQSAVNAATAGDTVTVNAGTYVEQILIGKNLTIVGADKATTIIKAPLVLNAGVLGKKSIFEVGNEAVVNVSNLTVSGPGAGACGSIDYGFFAIGTSTLNLSNMHISDITDTPLSGCQNGRAIVIGSTALTQSAVATINNVQVTSYQKSGIYVDGRGSSATITNSTITGVGSTSAIAQNGITFAFGATGTVKGNTVSGNLYTGANSSVGILLFNQGSGVKVENNTSTGNQIGVAVVGTTPATIQGNNLKLNTEFGLDSEAIINASSNYWGSSANPTTTGSLSTSTPAAYSPWFTDASMTTLSSDVTTDASSTSVTFASASETTVSASSLAVKVEIPAGTTISGPSTWDGSFSLPVATTTAMLPSESAGFWFAGINAVTLGSNDVSLTFDQAIKLTFAGQSGKSAGWSKNGIFAEITATCDSATNPTLASGADCKVDSGSDLVIWTKHATDFITFTKTAIPYGGGGSSSGGASFSYSVSSSGSGQGGVSTTVTASPSVINTQVVATTSLSGTAGQVLGAQVYGFSRDLKFGATGNDVTELQKMLIAGGYLNISTPTKYFGSLTRAAVKKWQAKNSISATGYFGPISRAFSAK